jgi:hypothetical protein
MHFEILVEDQSGKRALEILVPRIIGEDHTSRIISYKGIGRVVPQGMRSASEASRRQLLDNLPRLLRGYGKVQGCPQTVILVCELDDRCLKAFRKELYGILNHCHPKPEARFCIAIEEGESWLLGDLNAVKKAYPRAKDVVLNGYVNDSICGTWETLANAVYPGGARSLTGKGWQAIGAEKSKWAESITPHMCIETNQSPSFGYFVNKMQEMAGMV